MTTSPRMDNLSKGGYTGLLVHQDTTALLSIMHSYIFFRSESQDLFCFLSEIPNSFEDKANWQFVNHATAFVKSI